MIKTYIIFCFILIVISKVRGYTVSCEMKRMGYKLKSSKSKFEKIFREFLASITFFIPLFNLLVAFTILFVGDEKIIEKALESGDYILKEGD